MSWQSQYDREHDELVELVNSGQITREQFDKEFRELNRSYRESAEESAQAAYENELNNWW